MRLRTDLTLRILPLVLAFSGSPMMLAQQRHTESPVELVRKTVQNEVKPANDQTKFRFLERKDTPRGSQTKLIVETREATAGMVIAVNDRPLTPEEREAEIARIERFTRIPRS
jgi:hypothetical protein